MSRSSAHPEPTTSAGSYRPDIDGLRAVAILLVVVFHAFPTALPGGFIGVDIFFVISGFLITRYLEAAMTQQRFRFLWFYHRRIVRLFPALILVLVSCFAFGFLVLLDDEIERVGRHVFASVALIQNFMLIAEDGYFDTASRLKPLLHLWSLSVEEQFYLLWPLVLLLCVKPSGVRILIPSVLIFASLGISVWLSTDAQVYAYYGLVTRFWELGCGGALALLVSPSRALWINDESMARLRLSPVCGWVTQAFRGAFVANVLGVLALTGLVASAVLLNETMPFPSWIALAPVSCTAVILLLGSRVAILRTCLGHRWMVGLGLISYPLYLWHWPILSFLEIIEGDIPHPDARLLALLLAIGLAWLTYVLIEQPIRTYGRSRPWWSALLLTVFCGLGGAGLLTAQGWSDLKVDRTIMFRKGLEHKVGETFAWFEGTDEWLFLGNAWDQTVEKLKVAIEPSDQDLVAAETVFGQIGLAMQARGGRAALLVGPNKASVYPEYLPFPVDRSRPRYLSFYEARLTGLQGFTFYDPLEDLVQAKASEGLLYARTDSHWNAKGAYVAYRGLMQQLNLQPIEVLFEAGPPVAGDLIALSERPPALIEPDDQWVIRQEEQLGTFFPPEERLESPFGRGLLTVNDHAPNAQTVWVLGDSFTGAVRPFLSATFREVRYLGSWGEGHLEQMLSLLKTEAKVPDLLIIVRVERSF